MQPTEASRLLASAIASEDTYATCLLAIVMDRYGTEVFDWEPESMRMALIEDFGVRPPRVNEDKLQALVTCYSTNLFYESVEMFVAACSVFNDIESDFQQLSPLDPEELLWGMYEAHLNTALELDKGEKPPEFCAEIRRYIGVVLDHHGVTDPPDMLRIATYARPRTGLDQWADDPELFQAAYDKQKTNSKDILTYLWMRLHAMVQQLDVLPLQHRDAKRWNKLRDELNRKAQQVLREGEHADEARE